MNIFQPIDSQYTDFIASMQSTITNLTKLTNEQEIKALDTIVSNFKVKTEDFYRENRKLNIGVVGQVKAGKSSFLNTLLFHGEEILPKASTPKTATLTKLEYAETNRMNIEYYSQEEWEVLEDNARVDLDDELYTSAREIVHMVQRTGIDPRQYLTAGFEEITFATYEDLMSNLNNYVGEDGRFTPIVKAVTLYLNKEEFKGLSIVDTPGLNDPIASRTIRTKEFMEVCDVVFFLSQSGSFLDKSDWTLLSSQLPQKGVNRLVLIASKYDSGIRDVLRIQDEDDIFGEDENTADNIPKACKIIRSKLRKRARSKVIEFVKDLNQRESSNELIEVIQQCQEPILVSSLAYNMTMKPVTSYNAEEKNIYYALEKFSSDIQKDLKLIGNMDQVQEIFQAVVEEKEKILDQKSRNFIPNAVAELKGMLEGNKEKAEKRIAILNENDMEQLTEQRRFIQKQIGNIKADIAKTFGELKAKLETEKAKGIRELRDISKDYLDIKERNGSKTKTSSYTTGFWLWKKTHYYSYEENYSYCLASDAIDNIRKYSIDATNQVETVFTEALQLKELRRKLLDVVVNNFDMASEKYDASLFRIMVEEAINGIEFPVFHIDIASAMKGIEARFSGELTSAGQRMELSSALSQAVTRVHDEMCNGLLNTVKNFKESINKIELNTQNSLLDDVNKEFDCLIEKSKNKEAEIQKYQAYITAIAKELTVL